jgi:excisionase family DNA binding protein
MVSTPDLPRPGANAPTLGQVLSELGQLKSELALIGQTVRCLPQLETWLKGLNERLSRRTKSHLTVEEVAELTGRAAYTVRRWVKEKKLVAQRIREGGPKGRLLIPREEVERLIASGLGAEVPDAVLA